MRGQSTFGPDSKAWPTAPPYPFPEKVMHERLASPISFAAAARMGAGSTKPAGSCCAAGAMHSTAVTPMTAMPTLIVEVMKVTPRSPVAIVIACGRT